MKNKNGIIFGGIVLLLLVVLLVIRYGNKKVNWIERYSEDQKGPYTPFLAKKILKDYYPNHHFYEVKKSFAHRLKKTHHAPGNYFFLGYQYFATEEAVDTLLQFVSEGNNAFIATKELPYRLIFRLFGGQAFCDKSDYQGDRFRDSIVYVNLLHPQLRLQEDFQVEVAGRFEDQWHTWNIIPTPYLCESGIHPVGTINNKYVNFGFLPYGKGRIYFHTDPIVFTNYFLLQEAGKKYFDGVMAHLPEGNIYYDLAARTPKYDWNRRRRDRGSNRRTPSFGNEGPLTYILSQRSLATAWYLLLAAGLLYLTFRGKRKQRVIPIVEKNENTSLVFIQNISNLYFQQGNNKQLSLQKFTHFQDFVRNKYALNFKKDKADFAKKLAQKSGIPVDKINEILTIHQNIHSSTFLSDETMTRFHLAINHFYQHCK